MHVIYKHKIIKYYTNKLITVEEAITKIKQIQIMNKKEIMLVV